MKTLYPFILLVSFTLYLNLNGQSPQDDIYRMKRMVYESIDYRLSDTLIAHQFTEQDWVDLSPMRETRYEEKRISNLGNEQFTCRIKESSRAKEWDHFPLKIYSDEEGITLFDSKDEFLEFLPHSPTFKSDQDSIKIMRQEYGIPMLTDLPQYHELTPLVFPGSGNVLIGDEEHFKLKTGNAEVEVNRSELLVIEHMYTPEFNEPFYRLTAYQRSPQGFLTPLLERVKRKHRTPSGFCIEEIRTHRLELIELYVDPSRVYTGLPSSENEHVSIFPNPVNDLLIVKLKSHTNSHTEKQVIYHVTIINKWNQVVKTHSWDTYNQDLQLDVRSLIPGIYTLLIREGNNSYSHKFIKL